MTQNTGKKMKASDMDGMFIGDGRTPARSAPWRSRLCTGVLTAAVVAAFGGPFSSFAQQVQPDSGSGTRVEQAGNGVPVVQIATPNAGGVSHNRYQNYNVEAQGQILNNSQEMVKTQLGGYILGNANLQPGQSARIILNEVTSANPSRLAGHIEVAGNAAEVIVANPNGITCAGCGFINTTRNTLTTGTPLFGGDGSLSAFQVTRGLITVEGGGLNSTDRVDLIARAVQLNAGLWAKDANVVTGASRVGYGDLSAQAIAGEGAVPGYGLDVAALGGMYAQKIRLVGTEAGVGVRSSGEFVATGGDFVLTSAGDVQLSGRTAASGTVQVDAAGAAALTGRNYAEGDLNVTGASVTLGGDTWARNGLQATSRGAIDASGTVQAGTVRLDAAGNVALAGQVQSAQDMSVRAGATLTNSAQVVAGGNLHLDAADIAVAQNAQLAAQGRLDGQVRGRIDNAGRLIGSTGLNLAAGSLDNRGQIYGGDGTLKVAGTLRNQGAIAAGNALKIEAGALEQTANAEASAKLVELSARERIDNAGRVRADTSANLKAGRIDNSGLVYAGTGASLAADTALNNRGTVASDGAVSLHAQSLNNAQGAAISSGDRLDLQVQQAADNAGQLYAQRGMNVTAGSLDNRGTVYAGQEATVATTGALRNSGSLVAAGALNARAGSLDSSGEIGSETGDIVLDASGDLSSTGKTIAPGRLAVQSGGALTLGGQTYGGQGVQAQAQGALRTAGTLDSNGDIALRSGADLDNNARIVARGAVELKAAAALSNGADIQAARIGADAQRVENRGRLLANGDIAVRGTQALSNSGTVAAGLLADGSIGADGTVTLSSDGQLSQSGNVLAGRAIELNGDALDLRGGKINSGGDARLSARVDIDNSNGILTARNALTLETPGSVRNTAGRIDAARLNIQAAALDNTQGTLVQSGSDPLTLNLAGALDNAGGRIAANASTLSIGAARIDNSGGRIEHAGTGGASVRSTGDLLNTDGLIVGNGALDLQAGGALSNVRGQVSGVGAGTVAAYAIDNTAGTLASDGSLRVIAQQAIANQGGGIVQRGAGSLELRAAKLDNRSAGLIGAAGSGVIAIAGELDNRGGKLFAQNGLNLSADGTLRNNDGGAIQSGAALNLTTGAALDNARGQIDASGATQIRAASLNNAAGRLVSDSVNALDVAINGDIDNRGGTLGNSGGDTVLRGVGVDNGQGGRLIAGRDLLLTSNRFGNAGGLAYAERDLFYRNAGTAVDNSGGEIGAGRAVAIDAANVTNTNGRIVAAQLDLALSRLDNEAGDVSGSQRLNALLGALAGGNGRLFGHEHATIRLLGDYTHTGGQRFESNGVLALTVDGTLINQATLQSAGELQVNAAAVVNTATGKFNSSRPDDSGLTRITAGRIDNAGRIEGDGVALTAADVNNTGTVIGSRVRIESDRLTNGRDLGDAIPAAAYNEGFIGSTERTELRVAERLDNLDAEIYSLGDVIIAGRADGSRTGTVRNRSGRISAERDLAIAANTLINERRVFETRWRELGADEQAQNSHAEEPVARYRYDDPDPTHQPPNVDPSLVLDPNEVAKANETCRTNDNGDNLRCIGFRSGNGDAKVFRRTTTNQLVAVSEIARTSAESQIKAGRDIQLSGSDIVNDKSTIAAGANLIINATPQSGEIGSGPVGGGNVLNIAWTPLARVQRRNVFEVQQEYLRHDPRRWIPGGWWIYDNQDETVELAVTSSNRPWWMRTDPGTGAGARITAGQAVVIDAHNVGNGAVGTVGGSASVNLGQWNNGAPSAPGLGQRNGVDAVGGATGPSGVGGLLGPNAGSVAGNGGGATPPQVIGTPEQPLPNLVPPLGRLFTSNPGSRFLVESDPRFASKSGFLGSDYLLGKLGYSPDGLLKRLGDDFYEQRLVMEQITGLTGRKYLGASNGLDQYRDLMDAGAATASRFNLAIGIALTSQQIGALEQDIVWMVEQEVMGQKVLVPVVYLSQASAQKYRLEGASIAAQDVSINASGSLYNAGTIRAAGDLDLSARNLLNSGDLKAGGVAYLAALDDVVNRNGKISGGQVVISAGRDIVSETRIEGLAGRGASIESAGGLSLDAGRDIGVIGSTLKAGGNAALSAGRDLALARGDGLQGTRGAIDVGGNLALSAGRDLSVRQSTATAGGHLVATAGRDLSVTSAAGPTRDQAAVASRDDTLVQRGSTQALDAAGLKAGQNLVLQAGQDIKLAAAQLDAGKAIGVTAGRDIVSTTVTTTDTAQQQTYAGRTRTTESTRDETLHGTTFSAKGDIALQSGRDIDLTAAAVLSDKGAIGLSAGRDVNLRAGHEQHDAQRDSVTQKSGLLSSSKNTSHDSSTANLAVGTALSGDTVAISAGRDVTAQGAQIGGTGDVIVAAGRNLTLDAAESTYSEEHSQSKKKSGLMGTGGVGIMVGSRSLTQTQTSTETQAVGTLLGSTEGNVTLVAGQDVKIRGSDVVSATGTNIIGKNVTIEAAEQRSQQTQTTKFKQSGLELSLSGTAVNAAMGAYQSAKRSGDVDDNRLKALNAAAAGYASYDAYQAAKYNPGANAAPAEAGAAGRPQDEAINLKLGISSQSASSKAEFKQTTQRGSNIRSGGDVAIVATEGDITVTGSKIAGQNVALDAARNIVLQSAKETSSQRSDDKSGGGGIGVLVGQSGMGFYVEGNASRGKGDGDSVTHSETTIDAAKTLLLRSGGDTTLQGAQARGEQVVARIGGNLNLISEQDTDSYRRKDQSASGQVVIGYGSSASGSYNQGKIDSDYRSVTQQTGIAAGKGGFDIQVGKTTTLTGAAIVSTADAAKNRLSTQALVATDLKNEADYKATSVGVSASSNGGGGVSASPNIGLPQSDKSSSTTRSGISAGTIDIRGGDTGALASIDRSVSDLQQTGLKPIFDEKKVRENQEAGQLALEVGFRAAGTVADTMQKRALQDAYDAKQRGDKAGEDEALARVNSWGDGGNSKALLHGLTGAAAAALGGANALQGGLGAAGSEKAKQAMSAYLVSEGVDFGSPEYNSLMELGSSALGGLIGGGSGAGTGLAGDKYNRQLHPDEVAWINANASQFAFESGGISIEEAKRRLTLEAAAQLDSTLNQRLNEHRPIKDQVDENALAFLNKNKPTFEWGLGFTADEAQYNNNKLFADVLARDTRGFQQVFNTLQSAGLHDGDLRNIFGSSALQTWATGVRDTSGKQVVGTLGITSGIGGAAALASALVPAALTRCLASLAACNELGVAVMDIGMGDAALASGLTIGGAKVATAVVDDLGRQAASRVDDIARDAGAVEEVLLPAGYNRLRSAGAAANETGGLPEGYRRAYRASDGEMVILGPKGVEFEDEEVLAAALKSYADAAAAILPKGKVPSNRNGAFDKWFDELSGSELETLWADPKTKASIEARIRHPGELHEWCMVCQAPKFKEWGVSMDEVKRFRTRTDELEWIIPGTNTPGGHGGAGSTTMHNELKRIIENSNSLEEFNAGVTALRDRWSINPALLPPVPKKKP